MNIQNQLVLPGIYYCREQCPPTGQCTRIPTLLALLVQIAATAKGIVHDRYCSVCKGYCTVFESDAVIAIVCIVLAHLETKIVSPLEKVQKLQNKKIIFLTIEF